jgi:hypothetical protein
MPTKEINQALQIERLLDENRQLVDENLQLQDKASKADILAEENLKLQGTHNDLTVSNQTLFKQKERLQKSNALRNKILFCAVAVDLVALALSIWGAASPGDSEELNPPVIVFAVISLGLSFYGCIEPHLSRERVVSENTDNKSTQIDDIQRPNANIGVSMV